MYVHDEVAELYDKLAQEGANARQYRATSRKISEKVRRSDAVATVMDVATAVSGLAGGVITYLTVSTDDYHTMVLKDGVDYLFSQQGLTGLAWGAGLMGAALAIGFVSSKVKEYRDNRQAEVEDYREQIAISHQNSHEIMGEIAVAEAHADYVEKFWKNYEEISRGLEEDYAKQDAQGSQEDYDFDLITDHFTKPNSKDFLTLLPKSTDASNVATDDFFQQQ